MNNIEFLSCGISRGKPYEVTIQTPNQEKPVKRRLFFGGYSIIGKIGKNNMRSIAPVFFLPGKDGAMGKDVYGNLPTRFEHIKAIENPTLLNGITDMPVTLSEDDADSLANAIYNLNKNAYNNILRLMREMNVLFPGKSVRLDPANPVCAVNYFKHGCCPCNILAVSLNAQGTDLVYEVSNYEGDNELRDNDDIEIANTALLLGALMNAIKEPNFKKLDGDETFIGEDATPGSIPETDPGKTPYLHESALIEKLKKHLEK